MLEAEQSNLLSNNQQYNLEEYQDMLTSINNCMKKIKED